MKLIYRLFCFFLFWTLFFKKLNIFILKIVELLKQNDIGFRHWSEEGDNLERFGWIQHDGENFGVQEIIDRGLKFTTSFVKKFNADSLDRGGSWTARIKVEKKHKRIK